MRSLRRNASLWLPLLAFALVTSAAWSSWWLFKRFERAEIRLKTSLTAEQVAIRLEDYLQTRLVLADLFSQAWERVAVRNEAEFVHRAEGLMKAFPGLLAINWVDPEGIIRWVTPPGPNREARDRDLKKHPGAATTFLAVLNSGQPRLTPPIELWQGGRGMAGYFPMGTDEENLGFLNVVFRLGPMVDDCLRQGLRENFHFAIFEGDALIHASTPVERIAGDERRDSASFHVGERTWTVQLAPRSGLVSLASTNIDDIGALVALLLGAALAFLLRHLLLSREALRRSESRYRQLIELMNEGLGVLDTHGTLTYANPQLEAMVGYEAGSLVGKPVTEFFDEANLAVVHARFAERRAGRREPYELSWIHRDGGTVHTLVSPSPIWGPNHEFEGSVAIISDLTEKKAAEARQVKLEEQLQQSQRLEAIGRLAGGVAHDFNNILTGVMGFAELLQTMLGEQHQGTEFAAQIRKAAERGAQLNRQLLAFSRRQIIEPRVVDLRASVAEAQKMLGRLLGENVSLHFSAANDLWPVKADPGQIDQVLLNLVVNANDAIGDGGNIDVDLRNVVLPKVGSTADGRLSGEVVALTVSDDGTGIDPGLLSHIFEPFFTTKEKGKGTGLGLATVYGIVKQNGGDIEVHSRPGEGSTFRVLLPRSTEPLEAPSYRPGSDVSGGHETILPRRGRGRGAELGPGRAGGPGLPRARGGLRRRRAPRRRKDAGLRPPAERRDHAGHERPGPRRGAPRAPQRLPDALHVRPRRGRPRPPRCAPRQRPPHREALLPGTPGRDGAQDPGRDKGGVGAYSGGVSSRT